MLDHNLKQHCEEMHCKAKLVKLKVAEVHYNSRRTSKKKVKVIMRKFKFLL